MKTVGADGLVTVSPGEVFCVTYEDHSTSGYETRFDTPAGVSHLGSQEHLAERFGAAARAIEMFKCTRPGSYRIRFEERRPWETDTNAETRVVTVTCR